jgi:hypothetical protein
MTSLILPYSFKSSKSLWPPRPRWDYGEHKPGLGSNEHHLKGEQLPTTAVRSKLPPFSWVLTLTFCWALFFVALGLTRSLWLDSAECACSCSQECICPPCGPAVCWNRSLSCLSALALLTAPSKASESGHCPQLQSHSTEATHLEEPFCWLKGSRDGSSLEVEGHKISLLLPNCLQSSSTNAAPVAVPAAALQTAAWLFGSILYGWILFGERIYFLFSQPQAMPLASGCFT